ncbi:response regulator [Mucilaginibacter sp. SP1R1]|uniref:response regulator n=1 Tax=Mucilaginibacter sp. SP1R1 TaxID=2723091 RepID=UPI0016178196|nr:response regulator [Mucilaginibacter sp. SP1R1]MBB6152010.1 CheY-like chemotaxis protein [Mucilaginibacter sp. SP1R1]
MTINDLFTKVFCIDDDNINHYISEKYINSLLVNPQITTFINCKDAINELLNRSSADELPDYILLDINMPVMNGWDFLDEFNRLKIDPWGKIEIYIVSSSIFAHDKDKSLQYPIVKEFISKPLSQDKLKQVFKVN